MIARKLVWSHVVCAFCAAGIPVLALYVSGVKPRNRPFFLFDARISNPKQATTISAPVCVAASFVLTAIQVLFSEFYLVAAPGKWLRSLQALLNLFAAFAYQIFVQQVSAYVAGKQRPDFIANCKPDPTAYNAGLLRDSPVQDYALYTSVCTTDSDIKDHLKSFPSGHASSTACITLFGMLYFTYTYYVRRKLGATELRERSVLGRIWGDLQMGLIGVAMFAQFVWIWLVGVSRFIDNKHGVDDINSGWFLGTVFAAWGVWETFAFEHRLLLLDQPAAAPGFLVNASAQENSLDGNVSDGFARNAKEIEQGKAAVGSGGSAAVVELGEAGAPGNPQ